MSLPVRDEMMDTFQYRSIDSHLISVLLSECYGLNAYCYARQHLFEPLGIEHAAWESSTEGHSMAASKSICSLNRMPLSYLLQTAKSADGRIHGLSCSSIFSVLWNDPFRPDNPRKLRVT